MTFILVAANDLDDRQVNGWNWRPTLEFLRTAGVVQGEQYERMSAQGAGGHMTDEQCVRAADAVAVLLSRMKPGQRVLASGEVLDKPKSGRLDDPTIYSAAYEWLVDFVTFCRSSGGFEVL